MIWLLIVNESELPDSVELFVRLSVVCVPEKVHVFHTFLALVTKV